MTVYIEWRLEGKIYGSMVSKIQGARRASFELLAYRGRGCLSYTPSLLLLPLIQYAPKDRTGTIMMDLKTSIEVFHRLVYAVL